MPAIISLIYLMFSLLVFTKKITISNVLSAFYCFYRYIYFTINHYLYLFIVLLLLSPPLFFIKSKPARIKSRILFFNAMLALDFICNYKFNE